MRARNRPKGTRGSFPVKGLEGAAGLYTNLAALYLASLGTEVSRRGIASPLNRAAHFLDPDLEGNRAWQRAGWDVLSALCSAPSWQRRREARPHGKRLSRL
jgi:hypothetical protein